MCRSRRARGCSLSAARCLRRLVWVPVGSAGVEGELGLRVVRMNEEGGAAIDVGLEQAHAFVGGVPAFDDDVVELVAQVLVDDAFVLAFDFEEVGERADGGEAGAAGAGGMAVGAEEFADGVGGVAVLADEAFERVAAAGERGVLGAKLCRRGGVSRSRRRGSARSRSGGRGSPAPGVQAFR